MSNRIEHYQDAHGDWRWRIVNNNNGKIVGASSEGFHDEAESRANLERVGKAISEHVSKGSCQPA